SSVVIVPAPAIGVLTAELCPDFAAGKLSRMDIHIRGARADRSNDLRQLAGCDALARGPDDICRPDVPRYRSHLRAGLRTGGAVAEIGAEKDADAPGDGARAEVDVRLQDVRGDAAVAEFPVDLVVVVDDSRLELPGRRRRKRERRLLEARELQAKLVVIVAVGECAGCECKGGHCGEQSLLHTCLLPSGADRNVERTRLPEHAPGPLSSPAPLLLCAGSVPGG